MIERKMNDVDKLYISFLDINKAYDSKQRNVLQSFRKGWVKYKYS